MEEINEKIFQAWSKQMRKKALIIETLEAIGRNHLEVLNVKSKFKKNMKRRIVFVDTLDIINCALQEIIIDIRQGIPNWQDMMEIAFKLGSDHDIKIIMYYSSGSTDLGCEEAIAADFTKIYNENVGEIYLLSVKLIISDDDIRIGFDTIQSPPVYCINTGQK